MTQPDPGALEAQITALDRRFEALAADVRSLAQAVSAGQKTPWAIIIAASAAVFTVAVQYGNMSLESIKQAQTRDASDIKLISEQIVPRGEHEQHWRVVDNQIVGLQKQIDDNRRDYGSTFSLGDEIKQLNARMDRLEERKK